MSKRDPTWLDLYGTSSVLANHAARLLRSARSCGLVPVARRTLQRLTRARRAPRAGRSAPPAELADACSWFDELPQIARGELSVTPIELGAFMRESSYPRRYYLTERRVRYALWHYAGFQLADLNHDDLVLDAGAQDGIWGELARRRCGCTVFDADLQYAPGVRGHRIGCEIGAIPLEAGSLTCIVSFCAFNCFEGEADRAFLREASRLLAPGGRLVIVPLCVADEYVNLYDPDIMTRTDRLDERAKHIAWHRWGTNFGRWYDERAFRERFLDAAADLTVRIVDVRVPNETDGGVRDFHAAVCRKPVSS